MCQIGEFLAVDGAESQYARSGRIYPSSDRFGVTNVCRKRVIAYRSKCNVATLPPLTVGDVGLMGDRGDRAIRNPAHLIVEGAMRRSLAQRSSGEVDARGPSSAPTALNERDTRTTLRVHTPNNLGMSSGCMASGDQPLSTVCSGSVISVGLRAYLARRRPA
jgi:hypothetical protein